MRYSLGDCAVGCTMRRYTERWWHRRATEDASVSEEESPAVTDRGVRLDDEGDGVDRS
jgi:hypothetical protein